MTLYREERYEVKVSRTVLKTSLNWKQFELSLTMLPQRRAGLLLVFRVFEYVSYALVIKSNLPIHLLDEVAVP